MITIRDYSAPDANRLWDLHFHTIHQVNSRDYSQAQLEAWAPENLEASIWLKRMNALNPFIAVIDQVIVGYTDLQANGLIDHFFCHHQYQGQGVGRALMTHVLSVAKQRQLTRLHSEVSITAKPFYQHLGFSVVKQQQVEIRGKLITNFIMQKMC
jgi:putative acetyltransferase